MSLLQPKLWPSLVFSSLLSIIVVVMAAAASAAVVIAGLATALAEHKPGAATILTELLGCRQSNRNEQPTFETKLQYRNVPQATRKNNIAPHSSGPQPTLTLSTWKRSLFSSSSNKGSLLGLILSDHWTGVGGSKADVKQTSQGQDPDQARSRNKPHVQGRRCSDEKR